MLHTNLPYEIWAASKAFNGFCGRFLKVKICSNEFTLVDDHPLIEVLGFQVVTHLLVRGDFFCDERPLFLYRQQSRFHFPSKILARSCTVSQRPQPASTTRGVWSRLAHSTMEPS